MPPKRRPRARVLDPEAAEAQRLRRQDLNLAQRDPGRRREPDPESQPQRVGLRDYALAKDGSRIHIRSWDPTRQKYHYTAMGREWVNKKRVDYVVLLPVLIRTLRKNGTTDDYYGFFSSVFLAPGYRSGNPPRYRDRPGETRSEAESLAVHAAQGYRRLEFWKSDDSSRGERAVHGV